MKEFLSKLKTRIELFKFNRRVKRLKKYQGFVCFCPECGETLNDGIGSTNSLTGYIMWGCRNCETFHQFDVDLSGKRDPVYKPWS